MQLLTRTDQNNWKIAVSSNYNTIFLWNFSILGRFSSVYCVSLSTLHTSIYIYWCNLFLINGILFKTIFGTITVFNFLMKKKNSFTCNIVFIHQNKYRFSFMEIFWKKICKSNLFIVLIDKRSSLPNKTKSVDILTIRICIIYIVYARLFSLLFQFKWILQ